MDDLEAPGSDDAGRVWGDALQKEIVTSFVFDQHKVKDSPSTGKRTFRSRLAMSVFHSPSCFAREPFVGPYPHWTRRWGCQRSARLRSDLVRRCFNSVLMLGA